MNKEIQHTVQNLDGYMESTIDADKILGPLFRQVKLLEKNVEAIEKQFGSLVPIRNEKPPSAIYTHCDGDPRSSREDEVSVLTGSEEKDHIFTLEVDDFEPRPLSPSVAQWRWDADGELRVPPTDQVNKSTDEREYIDAIHMSMFEPIPLSLSSPDKKSLALVSQDRSVHQDGFVYDSDVNAFPTPKFEPPMQEIVFDKQSKSFEKRNSTVQVGIGSHFTAMLESFEKSMRETQKSQYNLQEWDRQVCGLKRSHCSTMRNSTRSRKRVRIFLQDQKMKVNKTTVMPLAA